MKTICNFVYTFLGLTLFVSPQVLAGQAFTGVFNKNGSAYTLLLNNSSTPYTMNPQNDSIRSNLDRLERGDLVAGNGTIDNNAKTIAVDSVDYVGLRKLLGPWVSVDGTIVFKDFSVMKFTPRMSDHSTSKQDVSFSAYQKEFRYSISPSEGDEWALFLSDDKSTTLATVEIGNKNILMKIFESESGKIIRTLKLERP